jgi:AcrR family transcriptional regulator
MSASVRRSQILQAATRLIARDGLNELTMVAVAKEAHVSRQLVYDHYPDLPTLFQAAFAKQAEQYALGLDDMLAFSSTDAALMARRVFEHLLSVDPETLRVVRALIGGVVPVELAGVRDDFRAAIGKRWSPWFRSLGFDDHSSNAIVWAMTAAYLSLTELVEDEEISADEAAGILAMLANGIVDRVEPLAAAAL